MIEVAQIATKPAKAADMEPMARTPTDGTQAVSKSCHYNRSPRLKNNARDYDDHFDRPLSDCHMPAMADPEFSHPTYIAEHNEENGFHGGHQPP